MQIKTKAALTYRRRLWPVMAVYAATLIAVAWTYHHDPVAGPLGYLLAALPGLPIVGVVVIMGLYLVEETDEFARLKVVLSLLWGIGLTLSVGTVWGFVETYAAAPHVPAYMVFPLFCIGMCIGQLINRWRYR